MIVLLDICGKIDDTITSLLIKRKTLSKIDIIINIMMLVTKIGIKIYKPTKYNEIIINFIHNC